MAAHASRHQPETKLSITTTGIKELSLAVDFPEETVGQKRWLRRAFPIWVFVVSIFLLRARSSNEDQGSK